jgi:hypothetical protein
MLTELNSTSLLARADEVIEQIGRMSAFGTKRTSQPD